MANESNTKALFIVVNAGFSEEVIKLARAAGSNGATILNARGDDAAGKSVMGITVDTEREIVLSLVSGEVAAKIMAEIKEKAGAKSPAGGICFALPVETVMGVNIPGMNT